MPKYYTTDGDDGFTGRLGEGRIAKSDLLIEAIGTIDEASAALGVARSLCQTDHSRDLLLIIQRDLYHLMAEVSATKDNATKFRKIDASRIQWLETEIDTIGQKIEMPKEFIVPGDSYPGASMAVARTVVRRAERRMAELNLGGLIENGELLRYLNRLSSLCFLLELQENQNAGMASITLAKDQA